MDTLTSRWYQEGVASFPPFLETGRETEAGRGGHMGSQGPLEPSLHLLLA